VISGIAFSNLRLWRLVRGLRFATDSALLELLEDCRQRMRVRTTVGLVVTDRVKSPLLFGFFRPRVLVPEDLVRQIPAEQLRYIFLHELAHLKRHDILVGWLLAFLQALLVQPLVCGPQDAFDRELACDAGRAAGRRTLPLRRTLTACWNVSVTAASAVAHSENDTTWEIYHDYKIGPTRLAGIWAVI
jgi:beta-lactamase regulating signal transducer with metallopeptidase domain